MGIISCGDQSLVLGEAPPPRTRRKTSKGPNQRFCRQTQCGGACPVSSLMSLNTICHCLSVSLHSPFPKRRIQTEKRLQKSPQPAWGRRLMAMYQWFSSVLWIISSVVIWGYKSIIFLGYRCVARMLYAEWKYSTYIDRTK